MRLDVRRISGEQLVSSLPHVDDGDAVVFRKLGNEVERHADWVGDRFVLVIDEVRHEPPQVIGVD